MHIDVAFTVSICQFHSTASRKHRYIQLACREASRATASFRVFARVASLLSSHNLLRCHLDLGVVCRLDDPSCFEESYAQLDLEFSCRVSSFEYVNTNLHSSVGSTGVVPRRHQDVNLLHVSCITRVPKRVQASIGILSELPVGAPSL